MAVALTEGLGSALLPCSGEVLASVPVVRKVTRQPGADQATAMIAEASTAATPPRALFCMSRKRSGCLLNLRDGSTPGRFRSARTPRAGCPAALKSEGRALTAEGRTARAGLAAAFGRTLRHRGKLPKCAPTRGAAASWLFKFRRQALALMEPSTTDRAMPNV